MFETPRHDLVLEKAAMQCIFMHEDGQMLLRMLVAEDFFDPAYSKTFQAMIDLMGKGTTVDFPAVCLALSGQKWWEDLQGTAWLAGTLADHVPHHNLESLASTLRQMTILRMQEKLKLSAGDVTQNLAALDHARDSYLGLLPTQAKKATSFRAIIEEHDDGTGILSGFNGIDRMTGGMTPGQFIVVGARTGVGKSIYLMNVAAHVAVEAQKKVLWIALEMSEKEVLKRFVQYLDDQNRPEALDHLEHMDIISGSKTAAQIESEAMRGKYDLIVLDYLQLVRPERRYDSDVQRLEDLTRRMKQLAMSCNTVLLAAAQLNRESEQHARPPRVSDLRGSGSIEQDADVVILIHRLKNTAGASRKKDLTPPGNVPAQTGKGDTTIFLEKNRAGQEGFVQMNFDPLRLRFADTSVLPIWAAPQLSI